MLPAISDRQTRGYLRLLQRLRPGQAVVEVSDGTLSIAAAQPLVVALFRTAFSSDTAGEGVADFAEGISDDAAGRRLARALQGRGAFRRINNQL